jgi:Fic family protein
MYIWEEPSWPEFRYQRERLSGPLADARFGQGQVQGALRSLGAPDLRVLEVDIGTDDAVETAAIEGETLAPASVRSSVARRLGFERGGAPADPRTEGVVEMILDATRRHAEPLTLQRLYGWHTGLFPLQLGGGAKISIGRFRDDARGPMQVISGRIDAPTVHFEAPPAARMEEEVERFLRWFDADASQDGLLFAGIAHLWFVTLHPFDDGNGRIARAIADMALSRDERSPYRFISMTSQIAREKQAYYDHLERAQRGTLDVTEWLLWFLACYARATQATLLVIDGALERSRFWAYAHQTGVSARQTVVLQRLLEDDWKGFLTAPKYAKLTGVSDDTAQRDIADLLAKSLLTKNPGGGKRTSYKLRDERSGENREHPRRET